MRKKTLIPKLLLIVISTLFLFSCENEIIVHTVTFISEGTVIQTVQVTDGQALEVEPAAPEAPIGKEFAFWSENGTTEYNFLLPIKNDITLEAVWNITNYKVTFINGFESTELYVPYNTTIKEGTYNIPDDTEEKEFRFWSTDGIFQFDFNKPITSETTLYAVWTEKTFTVNFKNVNSVIYSVQVKPSETIPNIMPPSDEEKTFQFWSEDGSTPFDFYSKITKDTTLYAVWEPNQYKVTFMQESSQLMTHLVNSGSTINELPLEFEIPEGKTFAYWSIVPDGSIQYDTLAPITSDITLYAVWNDIEFKVTFIYNGSVYKETTVKYGQKIEKIATPDPLSFWSENGSTAFDFYYTPIFKDMVLYSCPKPTYTVTFMNGDEIYKTEVVLVGHRVEEIEPPNEIPVGKSGFMFWSLSKEGKDKYNFNSRETEDITLYAIWMPSYLQFNKTDGAIIVKGPTNNTIEELIIPYGVTEISDYAFLSCENLKSVSIPSSVMYLGQGVFQNCRALLTVNIENGLSSIAEDAFYNCVSLSEIILPESISSIGDNAFENCSSLCKVILPETGSHLSSIGINAFKGCNSLYDIELPNSISYIGSSAFENCSSLSTINIPTNTTSIEMKTFYGCSNLKSISNFHNKITAIGDYSFSGCTNLTEIDIPDSVKIFGDKIFENCHLMELTIKADNITASISYAEYPFDSCSIDSVKLKNNSKYIPYGAFYGCKIKEIEIPDGITSIDDYAFYDCESLIKITIPNSVTAIGTHAFSGCKSLTEIAIPNTVTVIGEETFSGCESLSKITIPNSITNIDKFAFLGCTSLTEIVITNSVISIGVCAFAGCKSLTEVAIPNSVTYIRSSAFQYCSNLTQIIIPDSVTSIEDSAFWGCSSLTDIYCETSSQPIGWASNWQDGCDATVHWGYTGEKTI